MQDGVQTQLRRGIIVWRAMPLHLIVRYLTGLARHEWEKRKKKPFFCMYYWLGVIGISPALLPTCPDAIGTILLLMPAHALLRASLWTRLWWLGGDVFQAPVKIRGAECDTLPQDSGNPRTSWEKLRFIVNAPCLFDSFDPSYTLRATYPWCDFRYLTVFELKMIKDVYYPFP